MQPSNDVDDGSEKVAKKDIIYVLSNFLASIWTRSVCKMEATFSGVEFLRTLSRFKKRNSLFQVLRWWGRRESKRHAKSCRPCSPQFPPVLFSS